MDVFDLDVSGRMHNLAFREWVRHELAHLRVLSIDEVRQIHPITGHAAAVIEDARVTYNFQVMLQAGKIPPGYFRDPPVDPNVHPFYALLDGR